MSKIRLKIVPAKCGTEPMLNEALQGLQLPEIINTKAIEWVTINAKAQEVFGRFLRDWAFNWAGGGFDMMTRYISFASPEQRRFLRHIFFQLYRNAGGDSKDLVARKDYYAFTDEAWDRYIGGNIAFGNDKAVAKWRKGLLRALEPGKSNNVDAETMDKALDAFVSMRDFLQLQARMLYQVVNKTGPISDSQAGDAPNYSFVWSAIRKIMKTIRKYYAKRNIPMIYDKLEQQLSERYLNVILVLRRNRNVSKLIKYLNENEKNWVDIEKLLKDPGEYSDSWDAIEDFLATVKYRAAYDTMCSDAGEGEIAPEGKPCVIKRYDDDYFWFSRGGRSCEIFGEEGRNCGNGEYTLIDLQKTFRRGDQSKRSWYVGLDFDIDRRILNQILGFANSFPREDYWPYIADFIKTYDVEDIDEKAFQYLTQNDKVSKEKVLEFVMAVGNGAVKLKWADREEESQKTVARIVDDVMGHAIARGDFVWRGRESIPQDEEWDEDFVQRFERVVGGMNMDEVRAQRINCQEEGNLMQQYYCDMLMQRQEEILQIRRDERRGGLRLGLDEPTPEEQAWRPGMPTPQAESFKRMQKNLALKMPVEIDAKKAHAIQSWYKNKRNKIK